MRRAVRAATILTLTATALLGGASPEAWGHALVVGTTPSPYSILTAAPSNVRFALSEPVVPRPLSARVIDVAGHDVGARTHLDDGRRAVVVDLPPRLLRGSYRVWFRAVSDDGHPVDGTFVFSVGRRGEIPSLSLVGRRDAGGAATAGLAVARAAADGATASLIGGTIFLLVVWRPALARQGWRPRAGGWWWRAMYLTTLAGLIGALAGLLLQGAIEQGGPLWDALRPETVQTTLQERVGRAWVGRLAVWTALGGELLWARARRRSPLAHPGRWAAAVLVPGLGLAVAPALGGHAGSQDVAVLLPATTAHVLGMSVWVGGVAALLLSSRWARSRVSPDRYAALQEAILPRFSRLATAALAVLVVSAVVVAYVQVRGWSGFVDTTYGRILLGKSAVLLAVVAIAAVVRWRRPVRLGRRLALGDALRAEVALLAAVLVLAGFLAGERPPYPEPVRPVAVAARLGAARLQGLVVPAREGVNQMDLYLLGPDGAPHADLPLEGEVALPSAGIGPLPVTVRQQGPGHYAIDDAISLTPPGDWELRVRAPDLDRSAVLRFRVAP